jgi:hypothetical protein
MKSLPFLSHNFRIGIRKMRAICPVEMKGSRILLRLTMNRSANPVTATKEVRGRKVGKQRNRRQEDRRRENKTVVKLGIDRQD